MRYLLVLLALVTLSGCSTFRGKVRTKGGNEIQPPSNAQAASTVDEAFTVESIAIPKGSTLKVTKAATGEVVTEIVVAEATERKVETTANKVTIAPPRAPDQQVALRKADNAERRLLLWLSGACVVVGAVLLWLKQKAAATLAGGAALLFFLAWYMAGDVVMMRIAIGVGIAAIVWWLVNELREKRRTKEALTRTIQSIQEVQVDQPAMAREVKEYQEANLDETHKALIDELKPNIDRKYIDAQLKARTEPAPQAPVAAAPSVPPAPQ